MAEPIEEQPNQLVGTWRMVDARAESDGRTTSLYGGHADGLAVFTSDLHFVEVLRDAQVLPFAADDRTRGTAEENAAAVAGSLGQYGTYEVDADGRFVGNTIEGSTFPNWSGLTRTTARLRLTVDGDVLTERLSDPGAPLITIVYRRV